MDKDMPGFNYRIIGWLEKELEANTKKTLLFACDRLRPDLDPIKFVEECMAEAEKIRDDNSVVIVFK